ncbi:MAG: NigD-like protein [Tannerella sp.]|nr:NigD-like protein [Tannerella sp.]
MRYLMLIIGVLLSAFLFNSCDDDDDSYSLGDVWGSIATVRPLSENSNNYSLVLDDGTTLWPAANHAPWYTPKANQRAIVYYTILSDYFQGYDHAIMVRDISDILTKFPAENLGSEGNDEEYGTDPVEILDMWIGDGYLNVWFGFNYSGKVKHFMNLVQRQDINTPYYFEFRHNAYDDTGNSGQKGLVAFNLSSLNIEEEVTLTIKVNTFEGDKMYTIKYNPAAKETNVGNSFTANDIAELE